MLVYYSQGTLVKQLLSTLPKGTDPASQRRRSQTCGMAIPISSADPSAYESAIYADFPTLLTISLHGAILLTL